MITNTLKILGNLKNSHNIANKLSLNEQILGLSHLKWYGCFGVQSYINHSFLKYLNDKYNLINLISTITCRKDRCSLERILGCIFYTEYQKIHKRKSLFGDIMTYQRWGYTYKEYIDDLKSGKIIRPIVKVWTGR